MSGRERSSHTEANAPGTVSEPNEMGFYLYGIGRAARHMSDVAMRDGEAPLSLIEVGELVAVVREVPLADYSEETLQARLQDYDWLIGAAQEHQSIVAHVHQLMPILPAKFGTIYADEDAIGDALRETYDGVLERLNTIDGCDEWALHLFGEETALRERALAEDAELVRLREELETASPGRAYMLRQRVESQIDTAVEEFRAHQVRVVFEEIRDWVRDFHSDPPNEELRTDDGATEIARASLLVHRDDVEAFLTAIDGVSTVRSGIRVDVTGPWPPYTFTKLEEEA